MRRPLFDPNARKQTVSVSLNADLVAKSKELGINISKLAEEALAKQFTEQMREKIRKEIEQDVLAYDAFVAEHGSFSDAVREHYAALDAEENA